MIFLQLKERYRNSYFYLVSNRVALNTHRMNNSADFMSDKITNDIDLVLIYFSLIEKNLSFFAENINIPEL